MKTTCFSILLISILLVAFFKVEKCQAQNNKGNFADSLQLNSKIDSSKIKSPNGAMIRSLLFPGLGQWYNGKKLKAVVIFFAQTGLLANSIYLNQQLVKSQTDYEREFYINNRNLSVWWFVGVTLFSMADAYVDAQLSDFDESPDLSQFEIRPLVAEGSTGILVSYGFCF